MLKKEGHEVTLRIEAEPDDLREAINETYREISRTISVPGFRKGKVPRQIIDRKLGAENVFKQAVERGLPSLYLAGVESSGIFPVSEPKITMIETREDRSVVFEATVDVKPDVQVKDYKGIKVDRPETDVSDDDVERAMQQARERFATLEVVEGRPASQGDYLLFDYKAFAEGIPEEGASGSDVLIEIGAGDFLPGFDDQLVGARKGDIIDVVVNFPPDYGVRELAGKPATFRVIVKEIKTKVLPPMDDKLVKEISTFETVDQFKQDLRDKIYQLKEIAAEREVRQKVVDNLVDRTYIDIPESMIKREVEREIEDFAEKIRERGIDFEDYLKAAKITRYELEKMFRPKIVKSLKAELVLDAVAEAEGIQVSETEAEEYIRERVASAGGDSERVLDEIKRSGEVPVIIANMRLSRTVDFLVENAEIRGGVPSKEVGQGAEDTSDLTRGHRKVEESAESLDGCLETAASDTENSEMSPEDTARFAEREKTPEEDNPHSVSGDSEIAGIPQGDSEKENGEKGSPNIDG